MRVWAIAVCLVVSACGPVEDKNEKMAKEAVETLLTDPFAAQFRNLKVHSAKGDPVTVCGEVNAKNRMGGYNGFQRFAYLIATREARIDPVVADVGSLSIESTPELLTEKLKFNSYYDDQCVVIGMPTLEESNAAYANATKALNTMQEQ